MVHKLVKRLISGALALTLVFSINGFAAVVTDSDGSAFITKAEFDSLKNSFQAQIDSYNTAIDSKIDGAIAAYLAGIKISTSETREILNYTTKGISMMDKSAPLRYKIGYAYVHGLAGSSIYQHTTQASPTFKGTQARQFNVTGHPEYWNGANPRPFQKLLVSNLNMDKKIAKWDGFCKDSREQIALIAKTEYMTGTSGYNPFPASVQDEDKIKINTGVNKQMNTYNVNGETFAYMGSNYFCFLLNGYNAYGGIGSIQTQNNNVEKDNLCIFCDDKCYEFQNNGVVTNAGWCQEVTEANLNTTNKNLKNAGCEVIMNQSQYLTWLSNSYAPVNNAVSEVNMVNSLDREWHNDLTWTISSTSSNYFAPPVQGFESRGGFENWKQIYKSEYDEIAKMYIQNGKSYNVILEEPVTGADTKYHIAMTAGFPFLKAKKNERVHYPINPVNESDLPLYVWIKLEPFDAVKKPQEEDKSKFLKLGGNKGAVWDDTNKVLKIVDSMTTIDFELPEDEDEYVLWMKWSKVPATGLSNATGGGDLNLQQYAKIDIPQQ